MLNEYLGVTCCTATKGYYLKKGPCNILLCALFCPQPLSPHTLQVWQSRQNLHRGLPCRCKMHKNFVMHLSVSIRKKLWKLVMCCLHYPHVTIKRERQWKFSVKPIRFLGGRTPPCPSRSHPCPHAVPRHVEPRASSPACKQRAHPTLPRRSPPSQGLQLPEHRGLCTLHICESRSEPSRH